MKGSAPRIVNPRATVPPDGFWRFSIGGRTVESPVYDIAVRKTSELLRSLNVNADPETALAMYMCPRLPPWMCTGGGPEFRSDEVLAKDAEKRAIDYFSKPVETVDKITSRMQTCMRCKKHRRDFCLHCNGYDTWIERRFNGRRPRLPADDASGCCTCAGTFEAVIASVVYHAGDPIWKDVPDTCWRHQT